MSEYVERELGWDDEIEKDAGEFILLEPGDYDFTVINYERARYDGGEKLPPCNMAIVHCQIESPQGVVNLQSRMFLHTKTEGLLSAFFSAIGLKKKGEKLKMDWNKAVGKKGKCRVENRPWKNDEGKEVQSNDIKRFYPMEEKQYTPGQF